MDNTLDDVRQEPLSIPEECFLVKDWFQEEPTKETVLEILDWIKTTGRPHEWRGHTHTKPPKGAHPKYLDEFDVPTFGRIADRVAPCPCCTPYHAKYKRAGKIAWFPDERVVRLIGPKCFQSLSPEGHAAAIVELRKRKDREKAVRYLASSLPRLDALIRATRDARRVGLAVEVFQTDLRDALRAKGVDLWGHSATGTLFVFRQDQEIEVKDGSIEYRDVQVKAPFGQLPGYRMLEPNPKPIVLRLDGVVTALERTLDMLVSNGDVATWSDQFLTQALKAHNRTLRDLTDTVRRLADLQQFVGGVALRTLTNWGRRPDATMPFYISRERSTLRVGYSEFEWVKVDVPANLENRLLDVDEIDPGPDRI